MKNLILVVVGLLLWSCQGVVNNDTLIPTATIRVSLGSAGQQAPAACNGVVYSRDGRFIAFSTSAALLPADTNAIEDVYLRNLQTGAVELVSVHETGALSAESSRNPSISADGRYVVFQSDEELVTGDTDPNVDVYLRDRGDGVSAPATLQKSLDSAGNDFAGDCLLPSVSGDGQVVSFSTRVPAGLVDAAVISDPQVGAMDDWDLFVRTSMTTECVSMVSGSTTTSGDTTASFTAVLVSSLSGNGNRVAFACPGNGNFTAIPDPNATSDVFVRDRGSDVTFLVSINFAAGATGNNDSENPVITPDGSAVVFGSAASDLTASGVDANAAGDVFFRSVAAGPTILVSKASDGAQGLGASRQPFISSDRRFITFSSSASNLVPDDKNGQEDSFIKDLESGAVERVSVRTFGGDANDDATRAAVSDDGRFVVFQSLASNLTDDDTNSAMDVFLRGPLR